jgi:class 3 adenylate cyclase
MDDLRAVQDAVGSDQAALLGISEGGSMSMLFAGTYPDRVRALVLYGAYARRVQGPDYPYGPTIAEWNAYIDSLESQWGGPVALDIVAPTAAHEPGVAEWWAALMRQGASPAAGIGLLRMNAEIDARAILPAIRVPTLVIHRLDDGVFPIEFGRFVADAIPGARLVELPGVDHQFWAGDSNRLATEIEEFLTGTRPAVRGDRVLATLLFTDLVDSTRRLAAIGDEAWREVMSTHDRVIREILRVHGGIEVDRTGDGFLARFDGPGRAILAAISIRRSLEALGLEVRAGIHIGEVELAASDVRGIAVHLAARVLAKAMPGQILVTRTVGDLIAGSGIRLESAGSHELKGVPGRWELLSVAGVGT